MCIYKLKNKCYVVLFIFLALAVVGSACFAIECPASAADETVNFHLKLIEGESPALEVTLEFNVEQDEQVILSPEWEYAGFQENDTLYLNPLRPVSPTVTITSVSEETVKVEGVTDGNTGWIVTGLKNGTAKIVYRWQELTQEITVPSNLSYNFGDAPYDFESLSFPVVEHDIKIFNAADILMCPRNYPDESGFTFENYSVSAEFRDDETLLVPWKLNKEKNGFEVKGAEKLLENFITWGVLDEITVNKEKPEIVAGFSTDYQRLTDTEKEKYVENLGLLYEDLSKTLGSNESVERVVVVLCGAKRFSKFSPEWETLQSSSVIFHGGKVLEGESAAAAAGAFFDLWNGYAFVPASNGDSQWFEEGMSRFYPLKAANSAGLLSNDGAFDMLSETYRVYASSYPSGTMRSTEEHDPWRWSGLSYDGATLCASVDKRIIDETGGEKDISWLVSEISKDFKHSEGKDYGLNDMVEILDDGAGEGWQKFLSERVIEYHFIPVSEFTECDLFKKRSAVGSEGGSGSTTNWILLIVAIVVILSLPMIFSSYVRRAVKLDVKFPKIIPDDDFDDDEKEESGPSAEVEDKKSLEPATSEDAENGTTDKDKTPPDAEDNANNKGEPTADTEESEGENSEPDNEAEDENGAGYDDSDMAVDDGITLEDPMVETQDNNKEDD